MSHLAYDAFFLCCKKPIICFSFPWSTNGPNWSQTGKLAIVAHLIVFAHMTYYFVVDDIRFPCND